MFASLDAALGIFVQMCRLTAGHSFSPLRIEMQRPALDHPDCIQEFFTCPISFSQPENKIVFAQDALTSRLPLANPTLARANDNIVMDYLSRFDRSNLSNRVRNCIIEKLPEGAISQTEIAKQLNISTRSLQRKLNQESTNFA